MKTTLIRSALIACALSFVPTTPVFAQGLALLTYLKLKPGTEAPFQEELRKIVAPSRAETGNLAWFVQRSEDDPTTVVFYTRWVDEEALRAHLASQPLRDYIARTAPLLEPGYPRFARFQPLE